MTGPTLHPLTTTAPSVVWRCAAVLWLLIVLLVAAHQWRFWQQDGVDTDVLALLPLNEQAPDVVAATQQLATQLSRQLVVVLGVEQWDDTRQAAQVFRSAMSEHPGVPLKAEAMVEQTAMPAALAFYQPWRERLLTPAQRTMLTTTTPEAWVQQALQDLYQPATQARLTDWGSDPLSLWTQWWAARAAQSQARPRDGELWVAAEGQHWAVLQFALTGSAFSVSGEPVLNHALQQAFAKVQAQWPQAQMLLAGVPLHAEAAAVQAHSEINTIGWGSLAGVLLLAWLAFKSVRPVALVGLSLLVGCAVALSVTALIFGQVHLLTLVFGASLVGVAEDYGIHYFASRQGEPDRPAHALMCSLLPALWLALGTSVIAYLALGAAAFPGLRQMAVFSVVGLTAAMFTVVCWFPWLDRGRIPHSAIGQRIGRSLVLWPRWRHAALGSFLVCAVMAAWIYGSNGLRIQDDVRQLQNGVPDLLRQQRQVGDMLGLPSPAQFYLVKGSSAEQVLQREEALKQRLDALVQQGQLTGYSAVSDWVPSAQQQNADAQLVYTAQTQVLRGINAQLGESFTVTSVAEMPPLTVEAWLAEPISIAARPLWLGAHDGMYRSMLMLRGVQGTAALPLLTQAAQGLDGVTWVDKPAEISGLLHHYRLSMSKLLVVGHVLVLAALWLRFGRNAWRAWMPTVLATLAVLLVMSIVGAQWQLFNVLALMLLLGVGIDYGIFLQAHEDDPQAWLAVVIGAGSTWLSFGLLGLSQTPALRAFGLTLMLGLPLVLVLAPLFRAPPKEVVNAGAISTCHTP